MQASWKKLSSPVRSDAPVKRAALFALLTLCLSGTLVRAQAAPIVVSGKPVQLGALTGGGWDGSQEPVGGTFVVGVNGNVLVGAGYSANFLQITPSGSDTTLAAGVGGSAATLDTYGNLYFGGNYNGNVYKVPYDVATGSYVGWSGSAPTANCQGGNSDTSPCVFAPAVTTLMDSLKGTSGNTGFAGVAFDPQGNFFFESNTLPGTNPNSIYECNTSCIASSSATPTLIYKDSASIGALAIDPWGNIFFVDGNNNTGKVTNLNELPLSGSTYASSPTVVLSYTNAAGYGNGISGLAIAGNGTVYIGTNGDGIFAIPNPKVGGPTISGMYQVATQGGKGIALDSRGNLYNIPYNNGDVVSAIRVNNFSLGAEPVGTAATAVTGTIIDSSGACTPTLTATATQFGVTSTEFTVTPGTTCSAAFGGTNGTFSAGPLTAAGFSSFSVSIGFTPGAVGMRDAALTVSDSTNSATGVAALTGVGQGALPNLDPGVRTAYITGLAGVSFPRSVSADAAGDIVIGDGGGHVYEVMAGSTTLVSIGSGFSAPSGTVFDANGNLYIADSNNNEIYEIRNTGTTGAFVPGSQSTVISATTFVGGKALNSPMRMCVGPDGLLYVADLGNSRIVSYNPMSGATAVVLSSATYPDLDHPTGVAVDSAENKYIANLAGQNALVFSASGAVTKVAASGASNPQDIAVDPSGSLLIADASGNIVRVPNENGTLTSTDALVIEKNPMNAASVSLDAKGNIYTADDTGATVYAIQRTAAAIDLGTVQNGLTNSGTIDLENAGNLSATLATPAITASANTMFTLVGSATNGCTDGSSGPAGSSCQLTATFAPLVGTANGLQTGTASVNFATPAGSATVTMTGTATQSSVLAQTITGFNPPPAMQVGQQTVLSATGGASGNPVVFSIDAASSCPACASVSGATLTALGVGSVIVDANQAGGQANGNQYAAAQQVQATIVISNNLVPAGVPALTMNQQSWLSALPNGGAFAAGSAAGTSFGVNPAGNVLLGTAYGDSVYLYNVSAGTWTKLGNYGKYNNTGGVALDSAGNLYVSALYSGIVAKIPYNNGAYAPITDATSGTPPANCTGTDTSECVVAGVSNTTGIAGITSMTFDANGDLFLATDDQGAAHSIWECTAACMASTTGTPAPVMLYQEPTGTSPSTTGQLYLGGIAVDPWGNVFFTDSNLINQANTSNNESSYSDVYYLPKSTGAGFNGATTGYAAAPTLLQKLTVTSPGAYDDEIDGVVVAADGTVLYTPQYDGVFAIPNTQSGGPDAAHQYAVSGQGAKEIALDSHGNIFYVSYHGSGDTLGRVLTGNNLTTPIAQLSGAPVTASASVIDNAFKCSTAATIAIASSNSEFAATAGTSCSGISANLSTPAAASSYPATITFAATAGGPQTATLSLSDTTNGGTGTAKVTGIGQETPQTITFTAPTTTTFTYSPTLTVTVGATGGGSNNPIVFTVDSSSSGAGSFSGNTLTVTQAGTIVVDANQAGGLVNGIYYDAATQAQLTLTISKATQTILFAPPATPVTYAPGLTVTLSASGGGSGNTVTFTVDASSSGAGTVSGNTLTVTQAGTIVLDANQAGNVDYLAAPQVQQTLVVNKATQTVAFIPLSQPFHYIAGGVTLAIQATGGGSNDAITFTVDSSSTMTGTFGASTVSGSTSTAVLTIPAQTATSGAIIVDAVQPGNANYADSAQAQMTIQVLSPLPTQSITFANPGTQVVGTPLTLTATATSGFPVDYAAGPSTVCTVSGSKATFVAAGTCTIVASQPGDNIYFAAALPVTQSFTVNPTGQVPAMNINLSLSSLTIQPGTVGLTQLTVTSKNNFTGTVSFACSGQPSGYNCAFNPNPITVGQNATATTSLTVTPGSGTAALNHNFRPLLPIAFAFAFCFLGFRKRSRLHLLLLAVVALFGLGLFTACGGSSSTTKTQTTTSTITVTATSGAMKSSTTLTVIVQ